jgi:hypothetical protein
LTAGSAVICIYFSGGSAAGTGLKEAPVKIIKPLSAALEDTCSIEGDPGIYVGFPDEPQICRRGCSRAFEIAPANFGFDTSPCQEADTFCLHIFDTRGWQIYVDGPDGAGEADCFELGAGYYSIFEVTVTVPCTAEAGDMDTLIAVMAYCDVNGVCSPGCGDCMDPNWLGGNPFYSADTLVLGIEESLPSIYILQDTICVVERLQTQAYVPFAVCNGDPCSPPADYVCRITNSGPHGNPLDQSDTLFAVPGGECADVYAVVYGPAYEINDYDTLTIVAWDMASGTVYDTCVQVITIYGCYCVPVLDGKWLVILLLALLAAAAVVLRTRKA